MRGVVGGGRSGVPGGPRRVKGLVSRGSLFSQGMLQGIVFKILGSLGATARHHLSKTMNISKVGWIVNPFGIVFNVCCIIWASFFVHRFCIVLGSMFNDGSVLPLWKTSHFHTGHFIKIKALQVPKWFSFLDSCPSIWGPDVYHLIYVWHLFTIFVDIGFVTDCCIDANRFKI